MFNTEDSRLDPDYQNIHLQWFADEDDESEEDVVKDDESNADDKVKELEKELKLSKKESAGKDAKISKLLDTKKKTEDELSRKRDTKIKQEDFSTMSDETLKHKFEQMQDDADRRVEEVEDRNRSEIEGIQYKSNILNAVSEVDNLDPVIASALIKAMTIDKSVDDQDEIKDKIQSFIDVVNSQTKKKRYIFDSNEKVRSRPGAGEIDTTKTPSERGWYRMNSREQKEFSENASDEQLKKLEESGYKQS